MTDPPPKPTLPAGPPPRHAPPVIPPRNNNGNGPQSKRPKRGAIDPAAEEAARRARPLDPEEMHNNPSILLDKKPSDKTIPPLYGSYPPRQQSPRRSSATAKTTAMGSGKTTAVPPSDLRILAGGDRATNRPSSSSSSSTSPSEPVSVYSHPAIPSGVMAPASSIVTTLPTLATPVVPHERANEQTRPGAAGAFAAAQPSNGAGTEAPPTAPAASVAAAAKQRRARQKKAAAAQAGKEKGEEQGKENDKKQEQASKDQSQHGEDQQEEEDNSDNACTTCGQGGQLICCETCPRVFHPYCAHPPVDLSEPSKDGDKWYCRLCRPPTNTPLAKAEMSATVQPFQSVIKALHRAPPIHFYIPDTVLHAFPADLRAKVHTSQSSRHTRRKQLAAPSDFVCFRCVQQCGPDDSAKCCECGTMFHYKCVSPPLVHVGSTQPWRCPLHPPERFNRRFQLAKMGLRDFEPWMFTDDAPLNFRNRIKHERAVAKKATIQEQQQFLDCLASLHTTAAVTDLITSSPPQAENAASKIATTAPRQSTNKQASPSSSSSSSSSARSSAAARAPKPPPPLMPLNRALTGEVRSMTRWEMAASIIALRRVVFRQAGMGTGAGFRVMPHQEAYLADPESCAADVRAMAQLVNMAQDENITFPCLRLSSTGEHISLPTNTGQLTVGFGDAYDVNLKKHAIPDTPSEGAHFILSRDSETGRHEVSASPTSSRVRVRCDRTRILQLTPDMQHPLQHNDVISLEPMHLVYMTRAQS